MLASLSHKGKSPVQAVEYYTKALSEDPWLWEAFTGLCDIGELRLPHDDMLTWRRTTVTGDRLPRSAFSTVVCSAVTKCDVVPWTYASVVCIGGAKLHQPTADEPISDSRTDHIVLLHSWRGNSAPEVWNAG